MIWDSVLNAELAEPLIREVHLNFATDQPLRADRKDISDDQHPDHQFRVDRRPTHGRIMSCKFAAQPGKIESSIDLPHQMIFGDCVIELKLVEKLRLFALQPTHHGLPPPRFASARWNHGSPKASRPLQQNRHETDLSGRRRRGWRYRHAKTRSPWRGRSAAIDVARDGAS